MVETNKIKFLKKHNLPLTSSLSKKEISKLSKIPIKALDEVYDRGLGAYNSNLKSVRLKTGEKNISAPKSQKMSPQQWAMSRLYAFVMKTKKVFYGADNDIREKYKLK